MEGQKTATDEQIIEALEAGKTQREIIAELHAGQGRLTRLRKAHGLYARKATPAQKNTVIPTGDGLAGFRQRFDPAVRNTSAIETFLASAEFKKKGFIADSELRTRLRIGGADWTNIRQNYDHLLVHPRDPLSKTRKAIWCHPDIVEDARAIAQRS